MVKILVFAILLVASPAASLVEKLYDVDNKCQSNCDKAYDSASRNEACRTGCRYQVLGSDCNENCEKFSIDTEFQQICKESCTFSETAYAAVNNVVPPIAIDPVPSVAKPEQQDSQSEENSSESDESDVEPETKDQPFHSIILVRLREHPVFMPPPDSMIDMDPQQMFKDMIQRFSERIRTFEKDLESSFSEQEGEKSIVDPIRNDLTFFFNNGVGEEEAKSNNLNSYVYDGSRYNIQKSNADLPARLNEFIQQQSRMFLWSLICVVLLLSLLLFYMFVSLCSAAPKKYIPIEPKSVYFETYDYDGYTQEKIQPDDDTIGSAEPLPIKVKLSTV